MWVWLLALLPKIPGLLAGPVSQFVTGINIGQVLSTVGGIFQGALKYWRFILPVLLLLINAGAVYEWSNAHAALVAEQANHKADILAFTKAQADATAQANAERDVLKKEAKANADQADASYSTLLSKYKSSLLRYQARAAASGTGQASDSQLPPAQSPDGPGTGAQVSISVDDANVCAVNTARLQAAHDWALNPPKDDTN